MLRVQTVQAKDRDLLWNINQKYLYEMTCFYDDPMDESGKEAGVWLLIIAGKSQISATLHYSGDQ